MFLYQILFAVQKKVIGFTSIASNCFLHASNVFTDKPIITRPYDVDDECEYYNPIEEDE